MAAELSELEADYTHTPPEGRAPAVCYRISAADTTPESWVLERITGEGSHPEQLILFDTWAEAKTVLDGFVLRKAP